MEIAKTIESIRNRIREARKSGKKIGFVPTMGALHSGHVSLIEAASKECDFIVVSIFVNPTQFAPGEDFQKYPRPIDKDLKMCEEKDVDVVFIPEPDELYPDKSLTWVNVEKLTEPLCGRYRPGHFRGVTTVCAKLFNIVLPDIAYFGQKDAQQAIVIKKMVADLNMPLEIAVCPTVREPNGLAVSSRNDYLSKQQRRDASVIYKSLQKSQELIKSDVTDIKTIISEMRKVLSRIPSLELQYIEILDAESLKQIDRVRGKVLIAVAAKLGPARLIDNIIVDASKQ